MSNFRRMLMMLTQDLPKRESFQYGDEILSQDAYDYALSFGKKVVKDLKKVIDASENPALLIKRINDWKYLIHSLVDTGYTSWLKGDGSAYVNSGINASRTDKLGWKVRFIENSVNGVFFGVRVSGTSSSYNYNSILLSKNKTKFQFYYGQERPYFQESINEVPCERVGNVDCSTLIPEGYEFGMPYYICTLNNIGTKSYPTQNCIAYISINDDTFVPYYNGSYCMLDINSGEIHENANVVDGAKVGAFSLSVTDAKGNEYEDFCDVEGNRIVTTLNDGEILCWKQIAVSHKAIENCRASGGAIETIDDYISFTPTNGSSNNGTQFTIDTLNVDVKVFIQFLISQNTSHKMAIRLGGTGGITPDSQSLIQFTPTDEFKSYNAFANNLKQRSVCSIRNDALTLGHNVKYVNVLDVSTMFTNCGIEIPQTKEDFVGCFPNLGYTTYSASPIPLIVLHGTLHYALNKSVRDYAEEKGKLDALNAYCYENKDAITIFNADKTKVDTLLS